MRRQVDLLGTGYKYCGKADLIHLRVISIPRTVFSPPHSSPLTNRKGAQKTYPTMASTDDSLMKAT